VEPRCHTYFATCWMWS